MDLNSVYVIIKVIAALLSIPVSIIAITSYLRHRKSRSVGVWRSLLGNENETARLRAVEQLAKSHDVKGLITALDTYYLDVRLAAVEALADLRALDALAYALKNSSPQVCSKAADELSKI